MSPRGIAHATTPSPDKHRHCDTPRERPLNFTASVRPAGRRMRRNDHGDAIRQRRLYYVRSCCRRDQQPPRDRLKQPVQSTADARNRKTAFDAEKSPRIRRQFAAKRSNVERLLLVIQGLSDGGGLTHKLTDWHSLQIKICSLASIGSVIYNFIRQN